eukprot:COSAG01_NODE_69052_length_262_cov_0.957055_1_plen_37_part_10
MCVWWKKVEHIEQAGASRWHTAPSPGAINRGQDANDA